MSSFIIQGGYQLQGEIMPQGAKNEALQVICATLLTNEEVTIHNIPNILDVNNLIVLLEKMGVNVKKIKKGSYSFCAANIDFEYTQSDDFVERCGELRGSIMLIAPLLSRFGKAIVPTPGGDKIGRRRLDTHLNGVVKLGGNLRFDKEKQLFLLSAKKLVGNYLLLDEASVTGTANLLMSSVFAEGETTIFNAACEPYVEQLSKMLVSMGANIGGIGSNLLRVKGVKELSGCTHTLLPDMIEIGSFIGIAAMTGSEITIKNASIEHLGIIPQTFSRLGIAVQQIGNNIFVPKQEKYTIDSFLDGSILTIADAPWPGLTPDLLSVLLVLATKAEGCVLIHQKMFESRLFFVDKLIDMGAQIILCDPHRATVIGSGSKSKLKGMTMTSPDIRAGISLLIAALGAEGESVIHNIEQIDRGYEDIDIRLNKLGAHIRRIS
ncbi:MAG: UDP-N-acetylglucosamine 1-carboxyvinyltransferase [Dysgonamonadaceae bacterium]|nr:UDP-N-acetylglucosamine 1-carboxyvinyltransferase [Dysgonamonadaceae bacterium]MDD3355504.1 UDP-N-acetylglucosamine 1-carboxyvinyltransferase [Dysgonamonadaceae bacterium]MDD4245717.1 UDP-N-acetylglucosamine 1-carboxyvinyltransferase [Dysgonamonadaceae bacterium]HUI32616.1 UDP-N-acetylglucosamine 1-carboxyvinyltransferase [Dysgonamonadaceae bacterium]